MCTIHWFYPFKLTVVLSPTASNVLQKVCSVASRVLLNVDAKSGLHGCPREMQLLVFGHGGDSNTFTKQKHDSSTLVDLCSSEHHLYMGIYSISVRDTAIYSERLAVHLAHD